MSNVDLLGGSNPKPPAYRLMFVGASGEVVDVERLNAPNDEVALTIAEQSAENYTIELWDGLRFIKRFKPKLTEIAQLAADHLPSDAPR